MAKRRSREQIDADKIIKEYLNELGEKVYQQAGNK
jgi:predicted Zn-dependent protease